MILGALPWWLDALSRIPERARQYALSNPEGEYLAQGAEAVDDAAVRDPPAPYAASEAPGLDPALYLGPGDLLHPAVTMGAQNRLERGGDEVGGSFQVNGIDIRWDGDDPPPAGAEPIHLDGGAEDGKRLGSGPTPRTIQTTRSRSGGSVWHPGSAACLSHQRR